VPRIGKCGGGIWEPGDITVATVQTLQQRLKVKAAKDLLAGVDVLVCDEVHHMDAKKWKAVVAGCRAHHRFGLSATVWIKRGSKSIDPGTIWLRALIGSIRYSVSIERLIAEGHLVQPTIHVLAVDGPSVAGKKWSHEVQRAGIIEHTVRNQMIVDTTRREAEAGRRVIVTSNSLQHCATLRRALPMGKLVHGETPMKERRQRLAQFRSGELKVLIGTVFGEGVDIPENDVVVVGEGGKSKTVTLQRLRCLTASPGKTRATVYDFADLHCPALAAHSLERVRVYRSQPGFRVECAS